MRATPLVCWLFVLLALAGAQTAAPPFAPLRDAYQRNLTQLRTAAAQRAEPITAAYLAAIDRLAKQTPADAALAAAVARERERVTAKRARLENERTSMPAPLAQLAQRYDSDLERSNAPFQQQEYQQTRQYLSALETLQRRLTAENRFADAAAAHTESLAAAATLPAGLAPKPEGAKPPGAESTVHGAAVKAAGTLEAPVADAIAAGVAAKSYTKTEKSDPQDQKGWVDVPEQGGLLVGFEFFEVGKEKRIRSLRPYYLTREGVVPGKDRGVLDNVTTKVLARPGYAIGGILTNAGKRGMQVIFMKINPAANHFATDSASSYKSLWFGDRGQAKPVLLGGDGRLVIGVYGKTGSDCDDLGLVQLN